MAKENTISISEFAKFVGVSRPAIVYAIQKGKLLTPKKVKGKWVINKAKTKKEWDTNLDKTAQAKNRKKEPKEEKPFEPKTYDGLTLADAERQDKVYKARLSQLKYLEQAGKLVNTDEIQIQAFETGRKVRDAIMSIPPRVAHELAVETDPHTLETRLNKELTDALDRIIGEKK